MRIYDANNWLRRKFETGAGMRQCFAHILAHPGVVVFDGKYGLQRRKKLYPEYKARREAPANSMYKQFELFEECLQYADGTYMRVPGWEADDVIATLIQGSSDSTHHVYSSDVDFLQLGGVSIDRSTPPPAPPKYMRLYKAVVGDPSDNIPGWKKFGKKSWGAWTDDDKRSATEFLEGNWSVTPTNLPKTTANWLEQNAVQARIFWKIVGLYDVPVSEIVAAVKFGHRDIDAFEANLTRYML